MRQTTVELMFVLQQTYTQRLEEQIENMTIIKRQQPLQEGPAPRPPRREEVPKRGINVDNTGFYFDLCTLVDDD